MDIQLIRNQIRNQIQEEEDNIEDLEDRFKNCNIENTQPFDLQQYKNGKWCKVIDVYDGDTCTVVTNISNMLCSFKIRLYGYDAPELKPRKTVLNRKKVIKKGLESRNALQSQILGKIVRIESHGMDNFGRILGTIYTFDNININDWMLDSGFGIPYKK